MSTMISHLLWLAIVAMVLACHGQEEGEEGESCNIPNMLVPNAQVCFANNGDAGEGDLPIEKVRNNKMSSR